MPSSIKLNYTKASKKDYQGRESKHNYYFRDVIGISDLSQLKWADEELGLALLGYASDEGAIRNLGRAGAKEGPNHIRNKIGGLSNHFSDLNITDFGSFFCEGNQLELTQHQFSNAVYELLRHHYFPILVGGSHDITLPHFQAVRRYFGSEKRCGIINFDAHFDLREPINNQSTSGTSFYQIAQLVPDDFHYLPIGIQKISNHKGLFDTANQLGVNPIELDECLHGSIDSIKSTILGWMNQVDVILITIDMDCFSSAFSPGVSAPNPIGLNPDFVSQILRFILQSKKIVSVDFAETNPKYDVDNRTAQLAASLLWDICDCLYSN